MRYGSLEMCIVGKESANTSAFGIGGFKGTVPRDLKIFEGLRC